MNSYIFKKSALLINYHYFKLDVEHVVKVFKYHLTQLTQLLFNGPDVDKYFFIFNFYSFRPTFIVFYLTLSSVKFSET